jgi:threonine/homoserine/homoserine lactone efflux protein
MLTALAVGLAVGFVLGIPPGPIAVACIKQTVDGHTRYALKLAAGASSMDILYATVAAFASSALFAGLRGVVNGNGWYLLAFQVACIAVLIFLGIRYFKPKSTDVESSERQETAQEERARKLGYTSPYIVGVLIALTNLASPTFLPSLIFTVTLLHSKGWVGQGVTENLFYAIGFGIGAMIWFSVLTRTLAKLRSKLSPNFIQVIYRVAGGSFILFALILAYNVLTATEWAKLPR